MSTGRRKTIRLVNERVEVRVGLHQVGRHRERIVEVGKSRVGVRGVGVENGLRGSGDQCCHYGSVASSNVASSQLGVGIGYWQHFYIGNILHLRRSQSDKWEHIVGKIGYAIFHADILV